LLKGSEGWQSISLLAAAVGAAAHDRVTSRTVH
jgi:hypothetical protein